MSGEADVPTYTADIYIAGDIDAARAVCRQYCFTKGECVTVAAVEYIYKGAAENGVRVGFINYPRFPRDPAAIWSRAEELAGRLLHELHQHSYSIVATDKTRFYSRRVDQP